MWRRLAPPCRTSRAPSSKSASWWPTSAPPAQDESLRQQSDQLLSLISVFRVSAAAAPQVPVAPPWDGVNRRGPDRAVNVVRPKFGASAPAPAAHAAATGTDGNWTRF